MSSLLSRLLCAFLGNCETIKKLFVDCAPLCNYHLLLMSSFGSDGLQANVSHSSIGQPRELLYCCIAGEDWGRWLGLGTVEAKEDDHFSEL